MEYEEASEKVVGPAAMSWTAALVTELHSGHMEDQEVSEEVLGSGEVMGWTAAFVMDLHFRRCGVVSRVTRN